MKKQSGITLIALVITIIVLLILAGVSLSLVLGDNGVLSKAQKSVKDHSEAEIIEQIKLAHSAYQMAKSGGTTESDRDFIERELRKTLNDDGLQVTGSFKVTLSDGREYFYNSELGQIVDSEIELYPTIIAGSNNQPATENSRYIADNKIAIIPEGYTLSNVQEEQSIDTGLVVIDRSGNEWVWIPVNSSDLALMYTENETGWIMYGTGRETGVEAVITKYKTAISGNPGEISWREPDTLSGTSNRDNQESNYKKAGFSSFFNMAVGLRDDYKNMIDSIRKYGGFYVGRYELSNAGTQKNQPVLTGVDWYGLYAKCKTLGNDSAESRMIWRCQWDQICRFITNAVDGNGDIISLSDSKKYGNYKDSASPANGGNYSKDSKGNAEKKNTGSNEAWKTNNIYDLAGNCEEWTQATSSDRPCFIWWRLFLLWWC